MKFIKSFGYAFKGIIKCTLSERNFRIHIFFAITAFILGYLMELTALETAILSLTVFFVLSAEMFNTSIEKTIDLVSPEFNKLAGTVKDIAAGAVLLSAVCAIIVGVALFYKPLYITMLFITFISSPLVMILTAIYILCGILFIVKCKNREKTVPFGGTEHKKYEKCN